LDENCNCDEAEDHSRANARIRHDRAKSKDLLSTSAAGGRGSRIVAVGDLRGRPKLIARRCGSTVLIKKLAAFSRDCDAIRKDHRKILSQPDQPHH
jgi:selenophosphate synthetase-related protein